MPFITDALWRRLPHIAGTDVPPSIMIAQWPASGVRRDDDAEAQMNALFELIGSIRTLRSEYNVAPGTPITIHLRDVHPSLENAIASEERALRRMARVGTIERNGAAASAGNSGNAGAHAVMRGGTELFIPLAGIIDVAQERARLTKELERLDGMLRSTEGKLSNETFTSRAPADVIAREREKADNFRDQRERLSSKLQALQ
jgi:valyl-tRNA synthetase